MTPSLPLVAAARRDAESRSAAIECLTEINLDDLLESFGWRDRPLLGAALRKLLRRAAGTFARQIVEFDAAVGRSGPADAARETLPNYARALRVVGREHIPDGPFLALSNHPGMTDALALFGALERGDLLVVAAERPFLQALPQLSRHLSCLPEARQSPLAVLRQVGAHLRAGGAALSFPAGRIEPDPDVSAAAAASLGNWTPSAGALLRLAPDTAIVPVLVRGVVWPGMVHRRLGQRGRKREKALAALQLLAHIVLKVRSAGPTVQIGRPIRPRTLGEAALHQAVLAEMAALIAASPDRPGPPA